MAWRVSNLLAANGLVDSQWFTEASRERGRTVHYIAEQVFTAQSVNVPVEYAGYAAALIAVQRALCIETICVERRLTAGIVTGRPDVVGWLATSVGRIPSGPVILDVKSGEPYPSHTIQLGFYEHLADATPDLRASLPSWFQDLPWARVGLYVRADGAYRLQYYDDVVDWLICTAILDLTRWRLAHRLLSTETLTYADDPFLPDVMEVTDGGDDGLRRSATVPATGPRLALVVGAARDLNRR